jgi:two-component system, chemotaxis family, CheB/CheR fusion protein
MSSLKGFAAFVLENHLEEYVSENIGCMNTMQVPIMKHLSKLQDEQLREMFRQRGAAFLAGLRDGTAVEITAATMRQWETDTLPNVPKRSVSASDLVLAYACQKFALYKLILLYSTDPYVNMQLVRELEEYYSTAQNMAFQVLLRIQKETESELEKKNELLEEAQSIAHLGSWEYDPVSQKVSLSNEMYRIYGIEPVGKQVNADLLLGFFPQDRAAEYVEAWEALLSTGKPFRMESTIIRNGGEKRMLQAQAYPVFDKEGRLVSVHGTTQDITDIKKAEMEREISRQKDEFMSIASHELKTPLTSVKAYIDLMDEILKHNDNAPPALQRYVHKAKDNILKLHSLIADLLDISKINAGKLMLTPVTFNFGEVLKDCIETIGHLSPGFNISVHGNSDINVYADRHRIEQVVMNYLTNAVKYSPKSDKVEVSVATENKYLKVAVRDFGIGIPFEKQEKIFERFYRVNDDVHTFQGLGIGLYISAQIIHRHKGKVWVESEEGKGSTFYFTLPLEN